jgi:uncharacterized protein (DUF885 family)
MEPLYISEKYLSVQPEQIRKLSEEEVQRYLQEQKAALKEDGLKQLIEEMRSKLHQLTGKEGHLTLTEEIINVSQELDELIAIHMKQKHKFNRN